MKREREEDDEEEIILPEFTAVDGHLIHTGGPEIPSHGPIARELQALLT